MPEVAAPPHELQSLIDALHAKYLANDQRPGRHLHPGAREGQSRPLRHLPGHRRRPRVRGRRLRPALHHPVDFEAVHLRPGRGGTRRRRGAAARQRRAERRRLQLDRAADGIEPAVQPDDQHRRDHRDRPAPRDPRRTRTFDHLLERFSAIAGRQLAHRRGGLRVGAAHRPPQPRHRAPAAQLRRGARARSRPRSTSTSGSARFSSPPAIWP